LTSSNRGLIPIEIATYEKWRQYVYRQLRSVGIGRATDSTFHDLRRTYAVIRMKHLIRDQQLTWERASTLVARELGHGRTEILDWYISDIAMEAPAAP
jgi:integrase